MDKTYLHIYKTLYQHLYKFSISGTMDSRDAIKELERKVSDAKDTDLGHIYQIVLSAIDMQKDKFEQKSYEYGVSIGAKDLHNKWCLHSVLRIIYQYIYPDTGKVKISEDEIDKINAELDKKGELRYQIEFDDADYMIKRHIKKAETVYSAYSREYSNRDFKLQNRSFLTILKGYSSSTPFFYPALKEHFHNVPIKGGGIYIKWRGTGLVVDPGLNFMENMHMAGLSINDIDTIVVTHNHIDHNGDLTTIDDLAFQFGKRDIALYMDKQTEKDFDRRLKNIAEDNRHGLDLTLNPNIEFVIGSKKDICIKAIPTQHIIKDDGKFLENITYAVKISLKENGIIKAVIGFTSDTIYFEQLGKEFQDCDYVIANMSETDENDYLKKKSKANHLGYSGCFALIQKCNERIRGKSRFIISEFWAGKGDVRRELIKRLRKETVYEYIYPGDIGMTFFLDQPTFWCGMCGCERDLEQLHVIRPGMEYSKFCTCCEECILS